MSVKNDGIINWVEPNDLGFLPSHIEKDALSVMIRLLIAKVKEDHAMMQYKKELKHYSNEIIEIINFARNCGYISKDVDQTKYSKAYSLMEKSSNKQSIEPKPQSPELNKNISESPKSSSVIVEDISFLKEKK